MKIDEHNLKNRRKLMGGILGLTIMTVGGSGLVCALYGSNHKNYPYVSWRPEEQMVPNIETYYHSLLIDVFRGKGFEKGPKKITLVDKITGEVVKEFGKEGIIEKIKGERYLIELYPEIKPEFFERDYDIILESKKGISIVLKQMEKVYQE